jgi:hypothetical protein
VKTPNPYEPPKNDHVVPPLERTDGVITFTFTQTPEHMAPGLALTTASRASPTIWQLFQGDR